MNFKKITTSVLLIVMAISLYAQHPKREMRAAWIATVLVFGCFVYVLTGPMIHKRSALRQQQQQHSEGK